ncbi:MAG: SRPBCC domain-containing protein [Terracidiphilus sp.]
MSLTKQATAVADVEKGLVLATVEIAAPPERVFEALVREEDVLRWWNSEQGYRTTLWEADVRLGGKWRHTGRMTDGRTYAVEGEFTEVDAPHRLAFTWRPDWDAPNETHVTYVLEALQQGTRLTLRHEGFADRVGACRNHTEGWERVLGLLQADLRRLSSPPQYFLFRLIPPRRSFLYDATAEELTLMGVHGVYWRGKLAEGKVIAIGPVADPSGSWGVGILRTANPQEAQSLTDSDPVMLADKGFRIEVFPMPNAIHA